MKAAQVPATNDIIIRRFQSTDEGQVKRLFEDGMMSNTPDFFLTVTRSPPIILSILGVSSVAGFASQLVLKTSRRTSVLLGISGIFIQLASLYGIARVVFRKYIEGSLKSDLSAIQKVYGDGGCFLVAEKNGQIVGMVGGEKKDGDKGIFELRRMGVSRKLRNQRLGTRLIQALENESRPKKIFLTCISTQYGANALYPKAGFTLRRKKTMFASGVKAWLFPGVTYNFYEKVFPLSTS